jgi:hypothetical protein
MWNDTEGMRLIETEYPWFMPHMAVFEAVRPYRCCALGGWEPYRDWGFVRTAV